MTAAFEFSPTAFSRRKSLKGVIAGLIFALFASAYSSAEPCPTQCASGKILLGITAPTSGQAAASTFGAQSIKPAEIAVRELNATGGLMGIPVELAIGDDRCEPGLAIDVAYRQIDQNKINFVIGPTCPASAMATAPIYSKAGVIQFLPTVTVEMLGIIRTIPDNIFSMVATDQQEARALGEYLAREQKGKKLTVVYTDSYYRRGIVQEVTAALPAEMKSSARFEALLDISSMYDRLAEKIKRDRPDVIYIALDNEQFIELAAKLRKHAVKALVIGGQRLLARKFWLESRRVAEGIYVIAPIGSPAIPELRKTVELLKQAEIIPDLVALNSYAAVQTWAQAVRKAGSGDPRKVIEALRSGDFQTAVGSVAFDPQGKRRDILYSVLTWQDGRPRRVEPPE